MKQFGEWLKMENRQVYDMPNDMYYRVKRFTLAVPKGAIVKLFEKIPDEKHWYLATDGSMDFPININYLEKL